MTSIRLPSAISVGILIAIFVGQGGCGFARKTVSIGVVSEGQGRQIAAYADLQPDTAPGKKADMVMAGTRIPVNVLTSKFGPVFRILLRAHDETFETEVYRSGPTAFSLSEAGGDVYSPDVDLIRFPMQVGDEWTWEGAVSSGGVRRKATARVKSTTANLYDNGVPMEAVRVDVALSLYSEGTKSPAARKLVFEFVPGKGIVRREFGDASVREPAQP